MDGPRASSSLYRIRNVRRVMHYAQPMLTKHVIGFEADRNEDITKWIMDSARGKQITKETALDRIVANLRLDCDSEHLILMISPSKRHTNHVKLHALDCLRYKHLGMTTVTTEELAKLKMSQSFKKYNFLFASRYVGLKAITQNTRLIRNLVSSVTRKRNSRLCLPEPKSSESEMEENVDIAGPDIVEIRCPTCELETEASTTQTEQSVIEEIKTASITELKAIVKTLNSSLITSKPELERFFMCASKMPLLLLIRPALIGKSFRQLFAREEVTLFFVEIFVPRECYIGRLTISGQDLMQELDKYPKLLECVTVIEDVLEIVPVTGRLIQIVRKILFALRLEVVYDIIIELILIWKKKFYFGGS